MKSIVLPIALLGMLVSCTKNNDEPSVVYEGVWLNNYNINAPSESYEMSWSFLKPEVTKDETPEINTVVSYGSVYSDSITFTIKGLDGILSITTQKQKITNTYEVYTETQTFHEDDVILSGHRIEVTKDGIFLDGELKQALTNFQLQHKLSTLIDTETKQVQTFFTGETHQANSQSFTIGKENEEYKLTYLSPNEIEVSQTLPTQRKIGTIERQ